MTDSNGSYGFGRYAGVYRVATELRQAGYSVQVVEFFADLELPDLECIAERFVDKDTLFVGFATTLICKHMSREEKRRFFTSYSRALNRNVYWQALYFPHPPEEMRSVFSVFKQRNPGLKFVVGGSKVSEIQAEHLYPDVDFWVWGEADRSIVALADCLAGRGPTPRTESCACGERLISSRHFPVRDFNHLQIPWTDRDLLFPREHLPIEIARGCAFRCAFCQFTTKRPGEYIKSNAVLREELIRNYELFGTTGYMFSDDTYNDSVEKVRELHELFLSLPFQIEWSCYARLDMIARNPETARLLQESGMKSVLFGIETLNETVAKRVGKGIGGTRAKECLQFLRETWGDQVITAGAFIVGLPGESEASVRATFDWLLTDDNPMDAFMVNALYIKNYSEQYADAVTHSRIGRDPERFGYKQVGSRSWENEHLSRKKAEDMVEEFTNSPEFRSRNKVVSLMAFYSRMRNLGYTYRECRTLSLDSGFFDQAESRRQKLKQQYLKRLLNGPETGEFRDTGRPETAPCSQTDTGMNQSFGQHIERV